MTKRSTTNDDYAYKLQAINAVMRGWASYYRAVNPTETIELARPICLAPTQEMVGEEIWDRAKGGKTTVYATSTWTERRERRICSEGGQMGHGSGAIVQPKPNSSITDRRSKGTGPIPIWKR
jgi:hypothetical protein